MWLRLPTRHVPVARGCSEDTGDQVLGCCCGALSVLAVCEDRKRTLVLVVGAQPNSRNGRGVSTPLGSLGGDEGLVILGFCTDYSTERLSGMGCLKQLGS